MDLEPIPAERKSRRRGRYRIPVVFALLVALTALSFYYWAVYWPSGKHEAYTFNGVNKPIFYQGKQLSLPALGTKEGLKLPYPVFKELIDPAIRYEDSVQSVIVTTQDKVVRLKTNQLTGTINEKPFTLRFPVEKNEETVYVPIDPLRDFYRLDVKESVDTGAVILRKAGDVITWGTAAGSKHKDQTRALRSKPTIKASIYADVPQGGRVMIWGEEEGWYRIQLENGYLGYMRKADVTLSEAETVPAPEPKKNFVPWKPTGGRIDLTWQQVYNKNPDPAKFGPMPGVNVISPQWFILADGDGNLKQTADPAFMKWANDKNLQVWALFSNGFDPKRTNEALADYDKRMKIIKQLVSFSQMYGLQGINIDFENVYLKDKGNMVQFVRELTPFLHEQGIVVSIDVTVKDGSETYSQFLDRKALGQVVDYMMVMTYDEHWASSPEAGSVASLPWVEKGISRILQEDHVPASKLLLGVPFYTRIWTEQTKNGKTEVSSKTAGMDAVEKLIADKKLTPRLDASAGQNYVEYTEDGKTFKIWIEDKMSVKSRVELVNKYDLAGVASWSRGFEQADIWNVIKDTLEKRP